MRAQDTNPTTPFRAAKRVVKRSRLSMSKAPDSSKGVT
jgi:hypothetical protein